MTCDSCPHVGAIAETRERVRAQAEIMTRVEQMFQQLLDKSDDRIEELEAETKALRNELEKWVNQFRGMVIVASALWGILGTGIVAGLWKIFTQLGG